MVWGSKGDLKGYLGSPTTLSAYTSHAVRVLELGLQFDRPLAKTLAALFTKVNRYSNCMFNLELYHW